MDEAFGPRDCARWKQRHRLARGIGTALASAGFARVFLPGTLLLTCTPALAIGPGPVAGPINVSSGTQEVVGGTDVTSTSTNPGANVTGGTLTINGNLGSSPGAVRFVTASGNGLQASGTGVIQAVSGLAVTTTSGHAILANTGGYIVLGSGNLVGSGLGGGLIALGGRIDASSTAYFNNNASTTNGQGAIADSGGVINLLGNVSINTAASQAIGLGAGTNSAINVSGPTSVRLRGNNAMGIYLHDGGQVDLPAGFVIDHDGTGSVGVTVDNTTASLASGLTLNFNTSPASVSTGANSSLGVVAANNANATFENLTISGAGVGGGVWAISGGTAAGTSTSADATVTLNGSNVITLGDVYVSSTETHYPAYRILTSSTLASASASIGPSFSSTFGTPHAALRASTGVRGGTTDAQALITSNGTTIKVPTINGIGAYAGQNGAGDSRIVLNNNTVTTTGSQSRGLMAISNGTITANNTTVNTSGGSAALRLETFTAPGTINLSGSTVRATGATTRGISSTALGSANINTVTMSGGTLSSELGNTIVADGLFDMSMSNAASVGAGSGYLLYAVARTSGTQTRLNLAATGASRLTGSAYADTGAELDIDLSDRTQWAGAAYRVTNASIDASSQWTVTADSLLTNNLTNHGVVAFAPPVGGNFKVLSTRNYIAGSGTVAMNTYLGGDGSPSDVLMIDGGSATGSAGVSIANAGGPGELTPGDGILVVDAINDGVTNADSFALASLVLAGAYEYTLQRGSRDGSSPSNWYLRSSLDCTLDPSNPACDQPVPPPPPDPTPPDPDPPPPDPPDPPPTPPDPPEPPTPPTPPDPPTPPTPTPPDPPTPLPPPVPNYRAEVSLYAALPAMALRMGWATLGNLHERVGEEEQLRDRDDLQSRTSFNGAWVRVIGEDGNVEGDRRGILGSGPKYDYDVLALQAGTDVYREQHDDGHRDHAGLYLGEGRIKSEVTHYNRIRVGKDKVDATSLGGYWTHFWPEGGYLDAVVQGTWSDLESHSNRGLRLKSDTFGWAVSLEGGWPFHREERLLEPQFQIVYQRVDDFEGDDTIAQVRFRDAESLAARLGVRWAKDWQIDPTADGAPRLMTGWLRANVWHEFKGEPLTLFSAGDVDLPFLADISGTWWQLNAGATRQIGRNTSVYANLGYQRSFGGSRFDAWDGKVGFRWNW